MVLQASGVRNGVLKTQDKPLGCGNNILDLLFINPLKKNFYIGYAL